MIDTDMRNPKYTQAQLDAFRKEFVVRRVAHWAAMLLTCLLGAAMIFWAFALGTSSAPAAEIMLAVLLFINYIFGRWYDRHRWPSECELPGR